jgi:hypothetical protein
MTGTRHTAVYVAVLALFLPATVLDAFASAQLARSQPLMATVTTVAPIYISAKTQPIPLRTAAVGTRLEVLAEDGEWVQVRFGDPLLGPRVGWVQASLIRIERPELQPMDLSVSAAPSAAAAPRSLADAAEEQAQRLAPAATGRTGIPPAYKWTGIGLLIWGGLTTVSGFVGAEEFCYDNYSSFEEDCAAFKAGWIGAGVAITAAGAIVLGVGSAKRQPRPANALLIGANRVQWRVRF